MFKLYKLTKNHGAFRNKGSFWRLLIKLWKLMMLLQAFEAFGISWSFLRALIIIVVQSFHYVQFFCNLSKKLKLKLFFKIYFFKLLQYFPFPQKSHESTKYLDGKWKGNSGKAWWRFDWISRHVIPIKFCPGTRQKNFEMKMWFKFKEKEIKSQKSSSHEVEEREIDGSYDIFVSFNDFLYPPFWLPHAF